MTRLLDPLPQDLHGLPYFGRLLGVFHAARQGRNHIASMNHSHSRSLSRISIPVSIALAAMAAGTSRAATYTWLEANSAGGNNQWLQKANYAEYPAPDNTGTFAPTAADEFYFNTDGVDDRGIAFNSSATIGTLRFGAGNPTTSTNAATVITLDSSVRSDAGIIVESGGTATRDVNARLNLVGNITFTNNSTFSLFIGNATNGNGGIQGSGNLVIGGTGRVILRAGNGYANTGATTVNSGASLQLNTVTYTSSPITVGGEISGTGTLGTTTVQSGGRISPGGNGTAGQAPATLSFSNLLTLQAGAVTVIDVKAASTDVVDATAGSIDLGGELRLRLNTDYTSAGTYQLFQGLTGNSGNFDSVTIRTDADGATAVNLIDDGTGIWTTQFASRGYDVTFNANTGALILAVPEPDAGALSLITAAALIFYRKKRNS